MSNQRENPESDQTSATGLGDPTGLDKNLLDALTDHVCVLSEDGEIIAVNRGWREFATANPPLGTNVGVGSNYFSVCEAAAGESADTAQVALQGLRKVVRGESPEFTLEYDCHSPNAERWFELRATPKQGNPRYVVAIHRDITRRRQAEMRLRASEERYRAVVEDQTEVISRFLQDGRFTFVNDVYCRFFGKRAHELIGGYWQPKALPEDVPVIEAKLRMLSPSTPVVVVENRVYSGLGEIRWMQFVNRAFFDTQGQLVETQSVGRDITDRKRMEQALLQSETRYRRLHESMTDAFASVDMTGQIQEFNLAFQTMLGYSAEELRQLTYMDLTPPSWRAVEAAILAEQVLPRGFSEVYEKEYRRKDGTVFPVELRTFLIRDDAGRPAALWAIVRDITERKKVAEDLKRSREALRALAGRMEREREEAGTRIAREIHDELGHAMTDLKLDLAWLDRRLAEKGFASRCVVRSRIAQMSRRVDGHAQSVRRIATELRPPVLDALGLSAAIEWQAREFEQRSGVSCQLVLTQELLALDSAQTTALFRAFQEILSNITRHAQATRAEVVLAHEAGRLSLRVSDNGRGFEPARSVKTTALGLLGMQERAATLGGTVRVESAPGQGTIVTVTIPVRSL